VPLEAVFSKTAVELDAALVAGMNDAVAGGLNWVIPQLRVGLMLYVIGYSFLMMYGKAEGWTFASAVVRAMAIAAILKASNYTYYVRDFFFTDLPNDVARAIGGPRITVSSAEQFDVLWSAVVNYSAYVNGQAVGWSNAMHRGLVWLLAGADLGALWVCFGLWYLSRVLMAVVICLGPFLIIAYLFQATRGYVEQWIGKLVALSVLQLSASIVLRILLVILSSRLMDLEHAKGPSVDEMLANAGSVTGTFWFCAGLMLVLPSALAIGSGVGAGVAIAGGIFGGAIGSAGSMARGAATGTVKGAAKAGKMLGQWSGQYHA
jgi:type IV secretory pathway VirB6-like protein